MRTVTPTVARAGFFLFAVSLAGGCDSNTRLGKGAGELPGLGGTTGTITGAGGASPAGIAGETSTGTVGTSSNGTAGSAPGTVVGVCPTAGTSGADANADLATLSPGRGSSRTTSSIRAQTPS